MKSLRYDEREALIWNAQLSPSEKILLLALNQFLDAQGNCWTGTHLDTVKRMTGLGEAFGDTIDLLASKNIFFSLTSPRDLAFDVQVRIHFAVLWSEQL